MSFDAMYSCLCHYLFLLFANYPTHFWYWCGFRVQGFLLAATNFSILAWSLKMKRNDFHVQNGDIKEASSVFWSGGITRTQENCYTAWGKDLYYRHQSGICLMRGSIITIISRHEYTHAFMHVQMCVYCAYTSSPFILYASLIGSSHLFVNSLDKCFI